MSTRSMGMIDELLELEQLCDETMGLVQRPVVADGNSVCDRYDWEILHSPKSAICDYAAAAINALPRLIARVRELEAELAEVRCG